MSDDLYDGPCCAGCQHFHGGEVRHVKGCGHYAESLTKEFEDRISDLERQNQSLRDAQETHLQMISDLEAEVERLRGEKAQGVTVDVLAQVIRTVDGNHDLGAGELAERILSALTPAPVSVEEAARVLLDARAYEATEAKHPLDAYGAKWMRGALVWLSDPRNAAALRALAGGE